ncbi:unnamed protein product [Calypogeia fissa]
MPHFALHDAVLHNLGVCNHRCVYPRATAEDIIVPAFTGDVSRRFAHYWLKVYCRWAIQEGLSQDQTLLIAVEHMFNDAYGWGGQFLKGATWEDFMRAFCHQYVTSNKVAISKVVEWHRKLKARRVVEVTRFSYRELQKATNFFSQSNLIGEGGFGTVYQGRISENRLVAVKKLKHVSKEGLRQAHTEVDVLSQFRHPNLVKLLGSCLEPRDPLLVFEFVPNGNLMQHLHGDLGKRLSWEARMAIAFGTADAITHLHHCGNTPVYHRDVKSNNILLDKQLNAKVADFGLSRFVLPDITHLTTNPQGTPGYIDPCYLQTYHLTEKSDVYSFGVVLLELVSGLKVVDKSRGKGEITLASLALARIKSEQLEEIVDPYLKMEEESCMDMVKEVAMLAVRCLSLDVDVRPTIKEVADELQAIQDSWILV